jgi:L-lactate dehydrogenase complex protein LldG
MSATADPARTEILNAIRAARCPDVPLPAPMGAGAAPADLRAAFVAALKAGGGDALSARDADDVARVLHARHPACGSAYSCVPGIPSRDFTPPADGDPHAFESVDLAVVPGVFGVSENGAVWLGGETLRHRSCLFLAQHLAIVLPAAETVATMHDAYARLSRSRIPDFGLFIAGPSKTADIEQCLVIGAHGARSLCVVLVG